MDADHVYKNTNNVATMPNDDETIEPRNKVQCTSSHREDEELDYPLPDRVSGIAPRAGANFGTQYFDLQSTLFLTHWTPTDFILVMNKVVFL